MNIKIVRIIGIISLATFIIGIICAFFGIGFGIFMLNAYDESSTNSIQSDGLSMLLDLTAFFGSNALGIAGIITGILTALYNVIAHIPALIAYVAGKKNCTPTIYWLLFSLWLSLLFGVSFFIFIF